MVRNSAASTLKPEQLVGCMLDVEGIGACTVARFAKARNPFVNSKHVLWLADGSERSVVLRRKKAGASIGVSVGASVYESESES